MLIIISDLHLGDGTTANSISPSAFHLFANRLREIAFFASFRKDGNYRPIDVNGSFLLSEFFYDRKQGQLATWGQYDPAQSAL